MFRKIVSLIPFSPSYIQKLTPLESAIYQETKVRKFGLTLMLVLVALQIMLATIGRGLYGRPVDKLTPAQNDASIAQDENNLEKSIRTRNLTTGSPTVNALKAHQGELIEYKLTTTNLSQYEVAKDNIAINVSDILEYSDIIDAGRANYSGSKALEWTGVNMGAGETTTQTVLVRIKSPIPLHSSPKNNPASFDNKLSLVYGNEVTVNLPNTAGKVVENYIKNLPSTPVSYVVFITIIYTTFSAYYFTRSRLLLKELRLIKSQFNK